MDIDYQQRQNGNLQQKVVLIRKDLNLAEVTT